VKRYLGMESPHGHQVHATRPVRRHLLIHLDNSPVTLYFWQRGPAHIHGILVMEPREQDKLLYIHTPQMVLTTFVCTPII
jgi:hypothetical protein